MGQGQPASRDIIPYPVDERPPSRWLSPALSPRGGLCSSFLFQLNCISNPIASRSSSKLHNMTFIIRTGDIAAAAAGSSLSAAAAGLTAPSRFQSSELEALELMVVTRRLGGIVSRSRGQGSAHTALRLRNVRTSACAEEATSAVRPEVLTKKDLVNYLASGCKPKARWRIGTEHEKFGYALATLVPIDYQQTACLLDSVAERHNWARIVEDGLLFGLAKDGKSITLETGGQVELSGAPLVNLHQTAAELDSHFAEIKDTAQEMGIGFLGCGSHPKWPACTISTIPKERAHILRDCFSRSGTSGVELTLGSCSVQVNLDFSSEEDVRRKLRVGMALQPIATALFANSPFTEGKPNGFVSYRSELYKDVDARGTGDILPFVFDDNFGFERYVDYALNVPMFFAYRDNHPHNCYGMSFKDFIVGKLPNLPGEIATVKDWQNHLNQMWPEVRLRTHIEMRGADVGSREQICALPAFWVGLLYDDTSLQAALHLIEDWTAQECQKLREKVTMHGLRTPFRGSTLKDIAQDVVKLAQEGLERRGWDEAPYLDYLLDIANTGMMPADRLLNLYYGEWKGNVDNIFGELLY